MFGACDCAVLPSDEGGFAGKFSIPALINACISPFDNSAVGQAEFARRVDKLKHTYDYTRVDNEDIV
jgi:hypothetical protein